MFNAFRGKIANYIRNRPDLHEDIIVVSTITGTIIGSIYGAVGPNPPRKSTTIISDCIIAGIIGATGGALTGLVSPILIPTTIFGGTVGIVYCGYEKITGK